MSEEREVSTSELAAMLGVPTYTIRKWKARGFLPSAPSGRSGQGRGLECYWSAEAVTEARQYATLNRTNSAMRAAARSRRDGR